MKKAISIFLPFIFSFSIFAMEKDPGIRLAYKFQTGDNSRILSTVNEDVYVNGYFSHTSEILNRISSEIISVDEDGAGTCSAVFMTSEKSNNRRSSNYFTYGEEYTSVFTRDKAGHYDIEDIYFMPTVRNVPVFPDEPVKPGDTWQAEGHEAHDLRRSFDMNKPFMVPFVADYEYLRDETDKDGKTLNVLKIYYRLYFKSPETDLTGKNRNYLPAVTSGFSDQTVWWDNERGTIDHYSESFKIAIETYTGQTFIFQGTAHAEVTEFERVNTPENIQIIKDSIQEMGIEDVDVTESERGISIVMENIQFNPDSYELTETEKIKLQKIADILKNFKQDLVVTGHCAKRGTVKNQQIISEERAISVADYLYKLQVRDENKILPQGKGATEPIASNDTEAGRARNRRVEIMLSN